VGWAKFYDTADDLRTTRFEFMYGVGVAVMVGLTVRGPKDRHAAADIAAYIVDEVLQDAIGEWPGDYDTLKRGMRAADEFVETKWGSWAEATRLAREHEALLGAGDPGEAKLQAERKARLAWKRETSDRVRCNRCSKMVGRWVSDDEFEVACCRCKERNVVKKRGSDEG
jgi:phage FluMu protein Com